MTFENFILSLWLTILIFWGLSLYKLSKPKQPKYSYAISYHLQDLDNPMRIGFGKMEVKSPDKLDSMLAIQAAEESIIKSLKENNNLNATIVILNIIKLKK